MNAVEKRLCISTARIDLRSMGRELIERIDGLTAAATPTNRHTTAYINGATDAALEIHKMKVRFMQMNKTVNQLKEANQDNLEDLAHLHKQTQSVGKAHDDMTSSMISSRTSSPPNSTLSKLNLKVHTPEQIKASGQKGGWQPKKGIFE